MYRGFYSKTKVYRRFLRIFRTCRIFFSAVWGRLMVGLMVFFSMTYLLRRDPFRRHRSKKTIMSPKMTIAYSWVKMKVMIFPDTRRSSSNIVAASANSSVICEPTFENNSVMWESADDAKSWALSKNAKKRIGTITYGALTTDFNLYY